MDFEVVVEREILGKLVTDRHWCDHVTFDETSLKLKVREVAVERYEVGKWWWKREIEKRSETYFTFLYYPPGTVLKWEILQPDKKE